MKKYFEEKFKTKFGIDKLMVMVNLINVIEFREVSEIQENLIEFENFIAEGIGREMSPVEKINLYQGIINYNKSEPETNERMDAMNYLFELKFINE